MKHSELISIIKECTGITPKQKDLAKIIDKPIGTINSRASRDLSYTNEELEMIDDYFKLGITNKFFFNDMHDSSGDIIVDYFPDVLASCGNGAFELSQIREKIRVPKMCIEQYMPFARYSVINAYGDSMQPTIQSKDKLVIELLSDSDRIKDNNIYVFFYNDRIFCKRLVQNIDSIMVISDNAGKNIYPTSKIEKENMNEIHLIGRIVGLMRGMV